MSFVDLKLKGKYESENDHILNSFYIPVLAESKRYDRIAGFFTSSSLLAASKGIVSLIENEGRIRLITSIYLSKKDSDEINKNLSKSNIEEVVEKKILSDILTEEMINSDHVEALGWLISKELLDIRLVVVYDENGNALSGDKIDESALFHQKIGNMYDCENNIISFAGSINETGAGWYRNIESFNVFMSWKNDQLSEYIEPNISDFDKYWTLGRREKTLTIKFPNAVIKKMIEYVPESKYDLKIIQKIKREHSSKFIIRPYQNEAVSEWVNNGFKGLFNMATGTGKTYTSLLTIDRLMDLEKLKNLIVIIAVPMSHLIEDPWIKSINFFVTHEFIKLKPNFILAYGGQSKWESDLDSNIHDLRFGGIDNIFIITTYDTLSTKYFMSKMSTVKTDVLIICDEAHNSGAEHTFNGLLSSYKYRLGLSATPMRYFDEDGSKKIQEYFDKEVYTFSLKRAINEVNPSDMNNKTYLCPYYYHPVFVKLTDSELNDYKKISREIAIISSKKEKTKKDLDNMEMKRIQRARIVKSASEKITKLSELLDRLNTGPEFKHCLIYCSDGKSADTDGIETVKLVIQMLKRKGINSRRFTGEDRDRKEILSSFSCGDTRVLAAIKCLDEGVDVPSTRIAIIMASTGNIKEHIQRRGRVLRHADGKEFAEIYDFIVAPDTNNESENETKIGLFEKELKRFLEFSDSSKNHDENMALIKKKLEEWGIGDKVEF